MKAKVLLGMVVLLGVLLAAVVWIKYGKQPTVSTGEKVQVVATLFPQYDWVRQIGGEKVEVSLLLTGGAGAHDVSLTPQAAIQLQQADLLIMNGAGLETYLDLAELKAKNPKLTIVKMESAVINPIELDQEEKKEYPLSPFNPHMWLSPAQALRQIELIQQTLISVDPNNAEFYKEQGQAYIQAIHTLHQEYISTTAGFSQRSFIAFHDAMPYVAQDYGLTQVAVVEEFPGTAPSPQDILALHDLIKETGVRIIFTEPQFSPQVAQTLANDTGAQLAEFDTLETADPEKDTYISKMRTNLANMKSVMN